MTHKQAETPPLSPRLIKSPIIQNERVARDIVRLRIAAVELARFAVAGQFVNIKAGSGYFPLLRRPFSIHRVDRKSGWVEILFK
ncbi:MAG: hypothetical protein ONB16_09305, partial [candidate division KSB1 bacterium]|nr:hypothetical protein [candidate division KSB1 bacterium]